MSIVKIRDIRVINTNPSGANLTVVKIETTEPGLYGLGCATFAYRYKAVTLVVEEYLRPLLIGRSVADIEDLWHLMNGNAYWRNGPISNNAISGVDMALWDIKGKMASMPVYDLLGGKSRQGAAVYRHADGATLDEVVENVHRYKAQGVRHIRIQFGGYGGKASSLNTPPHSADGIYYCPDQYIQNTLKLFDHVRSQVGFDLELLHDSHERISPVDAVRLAKSLEPYRPFFLEDLLSPEQDHWYEILRQQCAAPIAIGELFNNPQEWTHLIAKRLIDFIRVHISQIGGLTPARKLAIFCEQFGVKTAWHGPGDVSPVGHAANVHLDINAHNFGIQEWSGIDDRLAEMFPGSPMLLNGYVYPNNKPGFGIELDEKMAARFPCDDSVTRWTQTRLPDGTYNTP
ncbi:enolase C-terminal domain-like protein [Gorillibacterium massiliense]|uniref:enolase C-terminal domain-like protein n=1 Tax=Gorillibacterium massiliense TaxID=1280390 RepID=UPI0004B336E8|nr:enolase C-terminal domain-like protein [Gorillibacterium massiliense]